MCMMSVARALRRRATEEAQILAKDLLDQLGIVEASTPHVMGDHERQHLMRHAINEIISKQKVTLQEQDIEVSCVIKQS